MLLLKKAIAERIPSSDGHQFILAHIPHQTDATYIYSTIKAFRRQLARCGRDVGRFVDYHNVPDLGLSMVVSARYLFGLELRLESGTYWVQIVHQHRKLPLVHSTTVVDEHHFFKPIGHIRPRTSDPPRWKHLSPIALSGAAVAMNLSFPFRIFARD